MNDIERKKVIRRIMPVRHDMPKRKRVAAYCRVSSAKDAMLHSLSTQVSHYSKHIQQHPSWEYAGVYVDEGITGTKAERPKFQKMLEDCRAGKIDMIITKSISRFARNTVTLLETVRELKTIGVDVYFEEQNIHTMSGDGELILTFLASFAQAESESVSENCKWRIRQEFAKGNPVTWHYMYGYRIDKNTREINPEEATVVRWIFDSYVNGMGTAEIARILRKSNAPGYFGGIWTPTRIGGILKNEKYTGNSMLQKWYVVSPLTKVKVRNRGELPMYYAEDTHPAIISVETYKAAQEKLELNRLANKAICEENAAHVFTSMIVCDQCGKKYKHITRKGMHFWNCTTYEKFGKSCCHTKRIPEEILIQTAAETLGQDTFDAVAFKDRIKAIHVPAFNHLIFVFQDGTMDERIWQDKSRRDSWTPEMKQQAAEYGRRGHAK